MTSNCYLLELYEIQILTFLFINISLKRYHTICKIDILSLESSDLLMDSSYTEWLLFWCEGN